MLIVTEMSAGKVLDEACNHNNDVYCDEALYTAWSGRPGVAARLLEFDTMAAGKPSSADGQGFMAHLYSVGKV
jgi:hypothetical protein